MRLQQHLLVLPLLAPALFAQYTGEGPTVHTSYALYNPLGAAALAPQIPGVTYVYQANLRPHASLPANTYYACLTVNRAASFTYNLVTGTFNAVTGAFTKNTDIDLINPLFGASDLFALTVSRDLLTACFDSPTGVRWATRANTTSQFTLQTPIVTGLPPGYIDPNFGYVNGKDVLFITTSTAIQFGDYAAGAVTNIRTVTTAPSHIHSPMPMFDKGGVTRAVTYVQTASGAAPFRLVYASSLIQDAGAPPYVYYTDTAAASWLENGDATGGTVTIISGQNNYVTPYRIGIVAANSSTYPAATPATVNLTTFAPQQAPTAVPYVGAVVLGALGTGPIPLGGIFGAVSLAPVGLVGLPSGAFNNASGTFEMNVPAVPLPVGAKIWYQTAMLDTLTSTLYLSSTGKVEWK